MAKGGKRHVAKPIVDFGLVFKALSENDALVRDLGQYETLSRTAGVDVKGLSDNISLLKALVKLERSAEVHPQPLKNGLLQMLVADPSLNKTKFNGQVWVNLRQERITCLLFHLRRFARDKEGMQLAAAKLTGAECIGMKELLCMLELRDCPAADDVPIEDSLKNDSAPAPVSPVAATSVAHSEKSRKATSVAHSEKSRKKRTLAAQISNVSVDSSGFPNMLQSPEQPEDEDLQKSTAPSFMRKRLGNKSASSGSQVWGQGEEDKGLQAELGFSGEIEPKTKAKKSLTKDEKASAPAAQASGKAPLKKGVPWVKLMKTVAKTGRLRAYICGTTVKNGKLTHIVEVAAAWSSQYKEIADKLMEELRVNALDKEQAKTLRDRLCEEMP